VSARTRVKHQTRAERSRRELLIKAGVWVFIFVFAFSVVGGIFALGALATYR
jgi:hypothetical protein